MTIYICYFPKNSFSEDPTFQVPNTSSYKIFLLINKTLNKTLVERVLENNEQEKYDMEKNAKKVIEEDIKNDMGESEMLVSSNHTNNVIRFYAKDYSFDYSFGHPFDNECKFPVLARSKFRECLEKKFRRNYFSK